MTIAITEQELEELRRVKREYKKLISKAKAEFIELNYLVEQDMLDFEARHEIKLLKDIFGELLK